MFEWLKNKKQTNKQSTNDDTYNKVNHLTVKDLKQGADEYDLELLHDLEPYTKLLEAQGYKLRREQDVSSGKLYYYKELKLRMVLVDVAPNEIYIDAEPFSDDLVEEVFRHKDLDTVFQMIYRNNYLQFKSGHATDTQTLKKELQKIERVDADEFRTLNK